MSPYPLSMVSSPLRVNERLSRAHAFPSSLPPPTPTFYVTECKHLGKPHLPSFCAPHAVLIAQNITLPLLPPKLALRRFHLKLLHTRNPARGPAATMSSITLSDLEFIDRETLASTFTPSTSEATDAQPKRSLPGSTAIIDVRDSDHIGGHIRGSTWVPSSDLDFKLPELLRTLQDKETVVFHCALSQQRGPSAALRYLREKERVEGSGGVESKGEVKEEGEGVEKKEGNEKEGGKKQKVVVLKGGFTEWQEKYGTDEELTEGYRKDVWEFGS